ncbi:DUF192 domain-containing protein [Ammoniphilus sp. YIM 78166]|uniref:DUF192 domain-containing protein n=1 Tax=Ammoniphilus sp. YIM 78166 TaxID=1644106 RepID=UPI00106F3649|nr:DUF192 domain-containing protein [Ammoniphilus sp. YIM 78166]
MNFIYVFRYKTFFRKMELALTVEELKKGLLGRTTAGQGMFLMGADAIHTFNMKFPIDVVYLNATGLVIGLEEKLGPNRQGRRIQDARHVAEFNPGTIRQYQIKVGEQWYWQIASTSNE